MTDTTITIATLNTLGNPLLGASLIKRYNAIATFFNESEVHVVQLQEVSTFFHLFLLKKKLKRYPYCIYAKGIVGPKGGLVIFSRFPLEFVSFVEFKHMPARLSMRTFLEALFMKGILIAKLHAGTTYLFNTHFHAVGNGDWSENSLSKNQIDQDVQAVHHMLKQFFKNGEVLVISGDFNIAKKSIFYRKLINPELLQDVFAQDSNPTYHGEFLPDARPNHAIDFIFIYGDKKQYRCVERKRILEQKVALDKSQTGFASDHIGLQTTVIYKQYFGVSSIAQKK